MDLGGCQFELLHDIFLNFMDGFQQMIAFVGEFLYYIHKYISYFI